MCISPTWQQKSRMQDTCRGTDGEPLVPRAHVVLRWLSKPQAPHQPCNKQLKRWHQHIKDRKATHSAENAMRNALMPRNHKTCEEMKQLLGVSRVKDYFTFTQWSPWATTPSNLQSSPLQINVWPLATLVLLSWRFWSYKWGKNEWASASPGPLRPQMQSSPFLYLLCVSGGWPLQAALPSLTCQLVKGWFQPRGGRCY